MRYLSFEESALRRMKGIASTASSDPRDQHHHNNSNQHADDDGEESSEDEAYLAPTKASGARGSGGSAGVLNMAEFARQKHDAYKSPALIVLEGMMDFTHEQFQRNLGWIVPLLSRLIICDDVEVRVCVRQIYQSFVNFLLIK